MTLSCSTSVDDPEVTFRWLFEERIISENPSHFIQNITEADSGTYTCRANISSFEAEHSVFVEVLASTPSETGALGVLGDMLLPITIIGGAVAAGIVIFGVTIYCVTKGRSNSAVIRPKRLY